MEKGIRTTEFWLTVVTMMLALLHQTIMPDLPEEAFYTVIAYIASRGVRKFGNS